MASCLLDRFVGWEAFLVKRGVACVLGRAAGLEQRRLRSHEENIFSSKLQQSFAGLCEGILLDSMRRQSSDRWTREAHLPKEYTENPPGSPGGHVSIAVPPALSRIGFLSRYYVAFEMDGKARWTQPIAHERTIANREKTMREIVVSGLFEKYSAIKRDGSVLYDGDDADEWIER